MLTDGSAEALWHLVLALTIVLAAARGGGAVLGRVLGQPPVIGEILAGIALGPSLLGAVAPSVHAYLFPAGTVSAIDLIGKSGALLYMAIVGFEFDLKLLSAQGGRTVVIGLANIGTPLLAGAALAVPLYARYAPPGVGLPAFALFLGVCLSITAFPVLARILSDLGIQRTAVGSMALACAAMGDIVALALVAILAGVAGTGGGDVILSVGLACVFLVSVALRAATVGAAAAPAGAAPEGSEPESGLPWAVGRLRDLLVALVLPAFFAYSGLRTDIGLVSDPSDWTACFAIVAGAVLGKLGGAYAAGRAVGLGARDSAAVGILLNTRGLMELVVIGIGLEIGIISPALFTMLVVMALVTTFATVPLLGLVLPSSPSATPGGRAG